ncbi:VPDSG-CTERM sorting domain-containing protein [Oleiharenicola lentus]|jgi:hypothetical protein|uniref:VPDSG-CTERM sorting domain-containing protein n=1 Tax=Oleiharenicola lentus TaxID=2508720 RepID=A0A4Q1C7C2_9BACT|nr:DUF4114 domain-containing protein [Oleiharenicola lentus]RXK54803.1 VPDSG-CTERM sorting domain-containing protein [Oleiharenicola lentus]
MKTTLSQLIKASIASAVLALAIPSAHAVPILGGSVVVENDGEVVAKFLGHTAGYTNLLFLSSPGNILGTIFNNQVTPVGSTMSLGNFTAGTELIFGIYVQNTGYTYYSGPANRNPDGLVHAVVDDAYSPTETYVGFEDLFGGGDMDYDDLNFSFTNVKGTTQPPGVPDSGATALLSAMGLVALFAIRKSVRR